MAQVYGADLRPVKARSEQKPVIIIAGGLFVLDLALLCMVLHSISKLITSGS